MTDEIVRAAVAIYGEVDWKTRCWWYITGAGFQRLALVVKTGQKIPLYFDNGLIAEQTARALNGNYEITSYWPGLHVKGEELVRNGRHEDNLHYLNWTAIAIPPVDYQIKFFPNLKQRSSGYTLWDYVFTGRCPVCQRRHRLNHGLGGYHREHPFTNWPVDTRWFLDCCGDEFAVPRWQMRDVIDPARKQIEDTFGPNQPRKKHLKW